MAYMMTQPGKKLSFMGSEIGQFREWDYEGQIEWFLLEYEMHAKLQLYTAELNHFYLNNPALWERDDSWAGFQWINADNREQSVLSYRRRDKNGGELIIVINFTPEAYEDYSLGVPFSGIWEEVFSSDKAKYGGTGKTNDEIMKSIKEKQDGLEQSIHFTLPSMAACIFRCIRKTEESK